MNIDLNEVGRFGYNLLRKNKVILDKDKKDLSLNEREEIINNLYKSLYGALDKSKEDTNHKYEFMAYLYLSVILYINNADLNKYIKMSPTN